MVMHMLGTPMSLTAQQLSPHKRLVRQIISDFLENSYDPEPVHAPKRDPISSQKRKKEDAASKPVKLNGLERAVVLAEPLANFLGEVVIPRSHIPKRITAYAKEHQLQDPSDKRRIICDDNMRVGLGGVTEFTFFTLGKLVSGLVYKPEECSLELQELAKECEVKAIAEKTRKRDEDIANGVEPKQKGKRATKKQKLEKTTHNALSKSKSEQKKKPTGLYRPMQLSEALTAVCGESQLPRPEVLKKIWVYINENQLKDPNDKSQILCDQKLKAVFDGSPTVQHMGINKYLSAHMTKIP